MDNILQFLQSVSVSYRGLTGVVAWMVKNALGVILAKSGNPGKIFKSS
ncbi:hypothetical protein [Rickettsia endosymbiont of Ceutorhynchus obstrictus]